MEKKAIDFSDLQHRLNFDPENHDYEQSSLSDSDTLGNWHSSSSPNYPHNIDLGMDACLNRLWDQRPTSDSLQKQPTINNTRKRRGRKPLRPNDPIKKKTEEKDKYWLRSFRAFMTVNHPTIRYKLTSEEDRFWTDHLGPEGKPDKGNRFLSYGRRYKNYLFSHQTFVTEFQDWFKNYSEDELSKKCEPASDLWFVFYDYGSNELFNYVPHTATSLDGHESPLSCASPPNELFDEFTNEPIDFHMVGVDNDAFIDSFLSQM